MDRKRKTKNRASNTHIRQNRLPKKGHKERPRRSLHNTQRKNPPRRYNIVNIYAPNIGAPKYRNNENLGGLQERC